MGGASRWDSGEETEEEESEPYSSSPSVMGEVSGSDSGEETEEVGDSGEETEDDGEGYAL